MRAVKDDVAPHAGAWIETVYLYADCEHLSVAPHAGAWIETKTVNQNLPSLKVVAPHAGAWIETILFRHRATQA